MFGEGRVALGVVSGRGRGGKRERGEGMYVGAERDRDRRVVSVRRRVRFSCIFAAFDGEDCIIYV